MPSIYLGTAIYLIARAGLRRDYLLDAGIALHASGGSECPGGNIPGGGPRREGAAREAAIDDDSFKRVGLRGEQCEEEEKAAFHFPYR